MPHNYTANNRGSSHLFSLGYNQLHDQQFFSLESSTNHDSYLYKFFIDPKFIILSLNW